MIRTQASIHINLCAGCTHITGSPVAFSQTTQKLYFYGYRKILPNIHTLCRLGMDHHTTVAHIPRGSPRSLVAGETILKTKPVIGIGFFVIDMAVFAVEGLVLVIRYAEHAVLY